MSMTTRVLGWMAGGLVAFAVLGPLGLTLAPLALAVGYVVRSSWRDAREAAGTREG